MMIYLPLLQITTDPTVNAVTWSDDDENDVAPLAHASASHASAIPNDLHDAGEHFI